MPERCSRARVRYAAPKAGAPLHAPRHPQLLVTSDKLENPAHRSVPTNHKPPDPRGTLPAVPLGLRLAERLPDVFQIPASGPKPLHRPVVDRGNGRRQQIAPETPTAMSNIGHIQTSQDHSRGIPMSKAPKGNAARDQAVKRLAKLENPARTRTRSSAPPGTKGTLSPSWKSRVPGFNDTSTVRPQPGDKPRARGIWTARASVA